MSDMGGGFGDNMSGMGSGFDANMNDTGGSNEGASGGGHGTETSTHENVNKKAIDDDEATIHNVTN